MSPKSAEDCESRLKKITAEFEEFAYIVSHDLKAPVRAINNLATWLEEDLEGNLPADSAANFKLLKNRVSRLDSMIQALLDYSRIARFDLETYPVNVTGIIEKVADTLSQQKPLKLHISGNIAAFNTFGNKLTTVLNHLLTNAIRFNDKPQAEINIELTDGADFATISIADNGPGIPEAGLKKIFTMFYTVLPKDTLETTGAGLAIVNKIVNFVGGELQVKNQVNSGAVFTVKWPKNLNPEVESD